MSIDIKELKKDLCELMRKHDCFLGVDIDGDTHGMFTDFVAIDSKGKSHILNPHYEYIDVHDLESSKTVLDSRGTRRQKNKIKERMRMRTEQDIINSLRDVGEDWIADQLLRGRGFSNVCMTYDINRRTMLHFCDGLERETGQTCWVVRDMKALPTATYISPLTILTQAQMNALRLSERYQVVYCTDSPNSEQAERMVEDLP